MHGSGRGAGGGGRGSEDSAAAATEGEKGAEGVAEEKDVEEEKACYRGGEGGRVGSGGGGREGRARGCSRGGGGRGCSSRGERGGEATSACSLGHVAFGIGIRSSQMAHLPKKENFETSWNPHANYVAANYEC